MTFDSKGYRHYDIQNQENHRAAHRQRVRQTARDERNIRLEKEPVIRKLLVGYEIRPRPNATYIKLIKELSAVGNNLNQIAHLANATGKITEDQWKETHQLLEKIWDFCAYEL